MAICIAGMHRSGTSMVSRLLNLCGLYIGPENELNRPAPDNQEGFWENLCFVELNEEILASLGGGWDLPPSAPNGWELRPEMIPFAGRAASLIQRFSSNEPWGWKDPRNALTFPFWKRLIPDLKVVICLRHPLEVTKSLYKRGYSSDAFTLKLWLIYNQRLLSLVAPEDRIITHYDAYFYDTQAELRRVLRFLTMSVSEETIHQACSAALPRLRHHSLASNGLPQADLPADVLRCYMEMCVEAGPICRLALGNDIFSENGEIRYISPNEAENGDEMGQSQAELAQREQTVDKEGLAEKELRVQLAEKEAQLERITTSLGWRLLSRYGRIKYRYILPLLRLLRLSPSAIAPNQRTEGSHKHDKHEDSKLAG